MLTKKQVEILSVFSDESFAELTFKEIKEKSGQKSNNIVQLALGQFKKQGIIIPKKTGDVSTYRINPESGTALAYLNLINETMTLEKIRIPTGIIKEIKTRISGITEFFILAVFGSFAKGKATEKSDLDIAVIVESDAVRKEITPFIETVKRREIRNIDYHVMTGSEFKDMLDAGYENLGKQIYKNSAICHGYSQYTRMMMGLKK